MDHEIQVRRPNSLLVRGSRIAAVDRDLAASDDCHVFDGHGATIVPGLTDSHGADLDDDPRLAAVPILLERVDAHASWANARAMALAADNFPDGPVNGGEVVRDPVTGAPSGVFVDDAMAIM
ncbi:hypothetical protein HK405_001661, partial [Cladochytrium tenue]